MKARQRILVFAALSFLSQEFLYSQNSNWVNVGPAGGSFITLAADPQTPGVIYAGTLTGLFKSKDGGASWTNSGLNGFTVPSVIVDPQKPSTLYARATGPDEDGDPVRVFKSIDAGASWNQLTSGLPNCCVDSLAIDPLNSNTLYATSNMAYAFTVVSQLLKSTDGGASWSMLSEPSGALPFLSVVVDPKTPGTVYAAAFDTSSNGSVAIYKSVDGGTSWKEADSGLPLGPYSVYLSIDPANPATIYAATSGGGVFKTTDGAASWHAANSGLPVQFGASTSVLLQTVPLKVCCLVSVIFDPENSNTLYVPSGSGAALFKSTDGGASWNAINSGLGAGVFLIGATPFTVDPKNSNTLYANTMSGVYRSTDGGATFSAYSQARAVSVYSVALDPQHSGAVLAGNYKSTDAGMSWTTANTNFGDYVVTLAIDPQNPNLVVAGTGDQECGTGNTRGVFRSVDGGASWSDTGANIGCLANIVFDPQNTGTVYAASSLDGGLNKSTDGGKTWNPMNSGLPGDAPFGPGVNAVAIVPQTSTLYAGVHGVYKSTDGGAHWAAANSGIPDSIVAGALDMTALAVDPQTPGTVYAASASYSGAGLWKSVDAGANWQSVLPSGVYALAINPVSPSTVYAGTDNGVGRSTDGGATWSIMSGSPMNVRVLALDPQDPTTLYAGGPGGLFALSSAPMLLSISGDGTGPGAIQHAGSYQLVSSANPATAGDLLVIYYTGLSDGSSITPQVSIGGQSAEVLWFADTPGYSGLHQVNVRVPNTIAPGPAVAVRMAYAGRPSNEVTITVQ